MIFFQWHVSPFVGRGLQIVEASRSRLLIHMTLGRTPLDGGSVQSRDLYLTTRNTHNRQTSMHGAGFEIVIPAREGPLVLY
jgi:hypothetical protein